ncbi:MAG: NERD domain-containing protein [Bacteroidota bacterium]|nr:NERD domain-containing protein [Bacteroidota bacterium]
MESITVLILVIILVVYLRLNRTKLLGKWGEKKVSLLLGLLGNGYKVFNDVIIRNGNWTSQIDHLIISHYGLFVIETKNYKGWIYGGADQEQWTQNIWGHKASLSNPIRQNRGHIMALKKILPEYSVNQYKSIIVFSSKAKLKTHLPKELNVIYTWQLLFRIRSFKEYILTDENIKEIKVVLQSQMLTDKEYKKIHVSNVKQITKRKVNLVQSGKCPRCEGELVLRKGRYGRFYGCSNYPKCSFTLNKES